MNKNDRTMQYSLRPDVYSVLDDVRLPTDEPIRGAVVDFDAKSVGRYIQSGNGLFIYVTRPGIAAPISSIFPEASTVMLLPQVK